MVIWPRIAGFLVTGYLALGRSFAYLGIPPLFVGEIVLGAFLFFKPRVALGTWATSLFRASPLNALGLSLLVFVTYGFWQVARGVLGGFSVIAALKCFTFNYYTIYVFMGIWVGLHLPDLLPKLVRTIAWVNGIYGVIFLVALKHVDLHLPGFGAQVVPLFSPPAGQVVVILGLLCFERDLRAVWFVLVLNIVITLVWQVRSEWAGLAVAILTWGLLTGRLGRVVGMGMAALAVLGLVALADIRLPGRNGEVSLSDNVGRMIAPIDLELAKELTPSAKYAAGTAEWRELWWEGIWRSVHSSPMLELFGHSYGFPLVSLAPVRGYKEFDPDAAQRLLLRPWLHGMGWGRRIQRRAARHRQTPLAVVPAHRTGGGVGLVGHGDGAVLLRRGLGNADEGDPLLPDDRHVPGTGVAMQGGADCTCCRRAALTSGRGGEDRCLAETRGMTVGSRLSRSPCKVRWSQRIGKVATAQTPVCNGKTCRRQILLTPRRRSGSAPSTRSPHRRNQ